MKYSSAIKKITWSAFLFGLMMISFSGKAQMIDSANTIRKVDSLIRVSRYLTEQKKFDQAMEINNNAETIALEKIGFESAAYASICTNKGRVLHWMKNYPEAE